jgi:hypothetical protein
LVGLFGFGTLITLGFSVVEIDDRTFMSIGMVVTMDDLRTPSGSAAPLFGIIPVGLVVDDNVREFVFSLTTAVDILEVLRFLAELELKFLTASAVVKFLACRILVLVLT